MRAAQNNDNTLVMPTGRALSEELDQNPTRNPLGQTPAHPSSPSWRKSRATLQRLTGSESASGVWMTCRSPAPREMVLYRERGVGTEQPAQSSGPQVDLVD